MKFEGARIGRGFWLRWVLASFVGWAVGSLVSDTLGDTVGEVWFDSVGLIALGTSNGGMQWLALRHRVPWGGWWVAANIAGWAVGALVNLPLGLATGWIVGLVVAGMFQWFILRRQLSRATWWLFASFVAWGAGVGISLALSGCPGACSGAVFGVVVGAMTGVALVWLLRRPGPELVIQPAGDDSENKGLASGDVILPAAPEK